MTCTFLFFTNRKTKDKNGKAKAETKDSTVINPYAVDDGPGFEEHRYEYIKAKEINDSHNYEAAGASQYEYARVEKPLSGDNCK